jgi:hypothetical protein
METQGANVVAHYVYGVNRVSRDANGSYEYYHADGLGSTRQISNNVYKYAGQWGYRKDGDDGLMHVGAWYYDPLVRRFISADTYLVVWSPTVTLAIPPFCHAADSLLPLE